MSARTGTPRLQHRRLLTGAAVVALVVSYVVAIQSPVPGWELDLTEWMNGAPDAVAWTLFPIMQFGTLGAPLAAAVAIAWWQRDRRYAGATVAVGVAAWVGAKVVKDWVARGRPKVYLDAIQIREGDGGGLGFISGHSAVAAATAVMIAALLPRRWRPIAAVAALLVGIGRIVHGVHLPADVVGGWSFGVLIGLAGLEVVERLDRSSTLRGSRGAASR